MSARFYKSRAFLLSDFCLREGIISLIFNYPMVALKDWIIALCKAIGPESILLTDFQIRHTVGRHRLENNMLADVLVYIPGRMPAE